MSDTYSKADAVRILTNLDTLGAGAIPDQRRAWAHLFIAMALLQKTLASPEKLTRQRFMDLAGKVHDFMYLGMLTKGMQS